MLQDLTDGNCILLSSLIGKCQFASVKFPGSHDTSFCYINPSFSFPIRHFKCLRTATKKKKNKKGGKNKNDNHDSSNKTMIGTCY